MRPWWRLTGLLIGGAIATVVLFILSTKSFLAYHTLVELLSITVSFSIFSIGWHSRRLAHSRLLVFLAVAYLAVGWLDLWHALAYKGMAVLPGSSANTATQLWVAARYVEAVSLLVAAAMARRTSIRANTLLVTYVALGLILGALILGFGWFPVCYVEGSGLTRFKIASEHIISGALFAAGILLWRQRACYNPTLLGFLLGAIGTTIASEFCFTLYTDVYGLPNFLGHLLKLISIALVYMSHVRGSLLAPYESLFRDLATSEKRYRQLFDSAVNAIALLQVVTDERGQPTDLVYVDVNRAFIRLAGRGHASIVGQRAQLVWPDVYELIEALGAVVCTGKAAETREFRLPDGRSVEAAAFSPEPHQLGLVLCDVTGRKQAEEDHLRFLQLCAHELSNPLTAVTGVCALLQRRAAVGRPLADLLVLLQRELDRLSELMDEVLGALRLRQERLPISMQHVNLVQVVTSALRPFVVAEGKEEGRFVLDAATQPIWVWGDPRRLEDVFRNLISNAVKYSPGTATIKITVRAQNRRVVVAIQDRGIGIPESDLNKVFEEFYRASNLTGDSPGGMGLGLYLCRDVVQRHGGTVWAESKEGGGTTFYVELPPYLPPPPDSSPLATQAG